MIMYMIANQVIGEEVKTIKRVSMIQLIANPEKYDNELIRVIGFTLVTDRTSQIYLSHVDYEHNIPLNAIGLSLDKIKKNKYFKNQKKYSIIEGTFNAKRQKSNLVNIGTIEKITRFDIWDYSYDSKQ